MSERSTDEWCRECRDEQPFGAPGVPADFILWGKFFPPEAFGPRCYDHAAKHIGWSGMAQIDQWAVYDLRPVRSLRGVVQAVEARVREIINGRYTIQPVVAEYLLELADDIRDGTLPAAAADAPQPARPSVPPPEPGVRACCGDTHLGGGCDPDAAGPSPAVLPDRKEQQR